MTRTIAFLIGCIALISGDLSTCAAGLGWKVLSHQSVKEPEVCFYGSANVGSGLWQSELRFVAAESDEPALNDLNLEELRASMLADFERVFPEYRFVPAEQLR